MLGAAIGILGCTAAAVGLGWASMDPQSQLYGRTFLGTPGAGKRLALTYDDGPNDPHTLRLLDVLAKRGVKATFFMVGSYLLKRPDIARAVALAGHEIGNHTWSHPNLIWCSARQVKSELERTEKALSDIVGPHSQLFRTPFGGRRPGSLRVIKSMGLTPVMWSVSAKDWELPTAEAIESQVWSRVSGGDVILMHDGSHLGFGWDRANTVAATDALIVRATNEGYTFSTVGEMMLSTPCPARSIRDGRSTSKKAEHQPRA
jgi:peptidoglycan-N-acetylglucosamine deacetylase